MSLRLLRSRRGVLQHGRRFDGRVVLEATTGVGSERRGARIDPDVRTPATAFAKFDIVDVGRSPFLEQRQKFMLRPVAGVGLRPDDEIHKRQIRSGMRVSTECLPVEIS